MGFSHVPDLTVSQINKAGRILRKDPINLVSLNLVNDWRAAHAYPAHTFYITLKERLKKISGEHFAAQRLKRMPTIIDKLKREPTMALVRMQDIAGVRAVTD